ncbi:MAG: NAD(P)-dependent oxidoreductase [Planctomycetes bacterium]|nr:NAD(P)-dependent oxidoreductase [Planctomycetota bacterium]
MKKVGIVGLGDMGSGMAKNIMKNGFSLTGFDLSETRMTELKEAGGTPAANCRQVAKNSDTIFVMVLNGNQVKQVVLGEGGLLEAAKPGTTIIISATIKPAEIRELVSLVAEKGINLLDTPVSGGKPGAENGTLTVMASGKTEVLEDNRAVLDAISKVIFHVGEEIGQGQTVKASLQAMIGTVFSAIFESMVLGAKAGVKGETLHKVFSASGINCGLYQNCSKLILDRKFKDTGSQIATMYKDLGISVDLARETGVPLFATAAAFQLFQSGISKFPDEDNWTCVKVLEDIAGTEVKW